MKTMKIVSVLLLLAILCVPLASNAKGGGFADFYNKYKDHENFEALSMKPGLLRMFMSNDDKEIKELMKHIKQFKMLVCDTNPDAVKYFSNELNEFFISGHYEDLLVVNNGAENVTFKARMEKKKIIELIMLARDPESLTVLYIKGDIDLNDVKELSKSVSTKKH